MATPYPSRYINPPVAAASISRLPAAIAQEDPGRTAATAQRTRWGHDPWSALFSNPAPVAAGAAHPTRTSRRFRCGMTRTRPGGMLHIGDCLRRPEPLPGQPRAVHPVPAGQIVPDMLKAGMHRAG